MITIEKVKKWVRISHDDDDDILSDLIIASLKQCEKYCNRRIFESGDELENAALNNSLTETELNNAIVQTPQIEIARLKLITDWYEYRGQVVEYALNELPTGIHSLLQPYFIYKLVSVEND